MNYQTLKKNAHIAGLLYFVMAVFSALGLMVIPQQILVPGNEILAIDHIYRKNLLYRTGIVCNLMGQIAFIFLALQLYGLFKDVHKTQAKILVLLVAISVAITFSNEINRIAPLVLLSGAGFLNEFTQGQLAALSLTFLHMFDQGIFIVGIFWGLWLFPFGYLVYKSGFIPRILGIFLIINCIAYVLNSAVILLFPEQQEPVTKITMLPMILGEFSMLFWLNIFGIKKVQVKE